MLFKKKPKEQAESTPVLGLDQQNQQSNQLATGVPSMKDHHCRLSQNDFCRLGRYNL